MTSSPAILERFSRTATASQWERIGFRKRAGVAVPLFSIYSKQSQGIGDFTDLRLLVEWCRQCGLSIIQLLPINDMGFNFRPYDALSMFALDTMFLSLTELCDVDTQPYLPAIETLRKNYALDTLQVNYRIKGAKLEVLWKMFVQKDWGRSKKFKAFREANQFWLPNYVLFKIIKQYQEDRNWEAWDPTLSRREPAALDGFRQRHAQELMFQMWLQWQAAEQLGSVKRYANEKGVLLLGDIPFLVSRDSADVWAHQDYFKLDLASGAPPDGYVATGQRWGMPPYNWEAIAARDYDYVRHKLKYAEQFFNMFRIDHFVGVFRLWTIRLDEPLENGGMNGRFDPADEWWWEAHGRRLVEVMIQSTTMLPCAEDLGVIPPCSYKVIDEYGLLGMDIQRWYRDWDRTLAFKKPEEYRLNSISVISTHDMSSFQTWWEYEVGTVDEESFRQKCVTLGFDPELLKKRLFDPKKSFLGRLAWKREFDTVEALLAVLGRGYDEVKPLMNLYRESYWEQTQFWDYLGLPQPWEPAFSPKLAHAALAAINRSASMFSIQLLQDWLGVTEAFKHVDFLKYRINCPGTVCEDNWTLKMPFSLETMLTFPENKLILEMNQATGRD